MPDEGSDSGFKYWAFISYSHADKAWGDWLHRALETYRVPKRLVGTVSPSGERLPARVYPIFRDREELPVSVNLSDNISHALEQSRYLIVICSPRSAASLWVNEEIRTFKRLGKEDRVLALIVAGEPNASEDGGKVGFQAEDECFPRALRYRWGTGGELSTDRTEPIAADARPDKDGKRNAKLKLLAGLLQVNYDQLRQREQERRVRQLSYLAAAALALLLVFAGLAVYSEVQRRRAVAQEKEAAKQRNTAIAANSQLKRQVHTASMADLATAKALLVAGSWQKAVMYLSRSLSYEPENKFAGTLLWDELIYGQGDRDRLPLFQVSPSDTVDFAVYSPDAARIFIADVRGAQQWETVTGKPIGQPWKQSLAVDYAAYSPDGKHIATVATDLVNTDTGYTAQIRDAATGETIGAPLRHAARINSIAYSPDGTRILTSSIDKTTQQWEAVTGQPIGGPTQSSDPVYSAAYSPDGTRIVTAGGDKTARQWDAATGTPVGEPLRHEDSVRSAAYSPDGRRIVTGCDDRTARQWNAETGQPISEPMAHAHGVGSAVYSPDGLRIVTTVSEHGVTFVPNSNTPNEWLLEQWSTVTCKPIGEPMHHEGWVTSAAYNADGTRILSANTDARVQLANPDESPDVRAAYQWEAAADRPTGELLPENPCTSAAYRPDGKRVAAIVGFDALVQYDTDTGKVVGKPVSQEFGPGSTVAYSPDGKRILAVRQKHQAVLQWDAESGEAVGDPIIVGGRVLDASYSPDGKRIAAVGAGQPVGQWDADTGQLLGKLQQKPEECAKFDGSLRFSPDGARIVTAGPGNTARQWDAATGRPIGGILQHDDNVRSAAYSLDGRRIVTAGEDNTARQWDAATGQPIGRPLRHDRTVRSAEYSPDGTRIITASEDRTVRQWDAATGGALGSALRFQAGVEDGYFERATYRADRRRILTFTHRGDVQQWECKFSVGPPPADLHSLVEVLAGLKFDENGVLQHLAMKDRLALRAGLRQRPASPSDVANWDRIMGWVISPSSERPYTPDSKFSLSDVAAHKLDGNGVEPLLSASELAPALPLLDLSLASYTKDTLRADFLRRCGIQRLPNDPAILVRAAAILRQEQQLPLAVQTLERAVAASQNSDPVLLAGLALTLWLANDHDGAVRECQQLISVDASYADPNKMPAVATLSGKDKAALLAAIAETLQRHPELASKPGK